MFWKKSVTLQIQTKGLLTEWLGTGLQNRLLQFESGRDLKETGESDIFQARLFFAHNNKLTKTLPKQKHTSMGKKQFISFFVAVLFVSALSISCNSSTSNSSQQPADAAETEASGDDAVVKHINSVETFNKTISNNGKLVLVDFWAEWCRPCKMVAPIVEAVATENADKLVVAKVDMEQDWVIGAFARSYYIEAIPCFILFSNGKEVARTEGYMEKDEFDSWLKDYLK